MQTDNENNIKEPWVLLEKTMVLKLPMAIISTFFALAALQGYLANIEYLYRPITGGPATNPLTAIIIFLLATSIWASIKLNNSFFVHFLAITGLILSALKLLEFIIDIPTSQYITPFYAQVYSDIQQGKSNSMGLNTTIMLLLSGVAIELKFLNYKLCSQMVASLCFTLPMVSLTGYVYDIHVFHGQMSLLTTVFGFTLTIAILSMSADVGGLKAILNPNFSGRIARVHALAGFMIPLVLGFIVVKSIQTPIQFSYFGLYVVAVCWFIILVVGCTAVIHEEIDTKRRLAEERLHNIALIDSLTNLPNRRYFFEEAEKSLKQIKHTKGDGALAMLDIDHFKSINDTYGHHIGDEVLKGLSICFSKYFEKHLVARLGGEEFAIYFADSDKQEALKKLESFRAFIEKNSHEFSKAKIKFTLSIGFSCGPVYQIDELLKQADLKLYDAKEQGRNKVVS